MSPLKSTTSTTSTSGCCLVSVTLLVVAYVDADRVGLLGAHDQDEATVGHLALADLLAQRLARVLYLQADAKELSLTR